MSSKYFIEYEALVYNMPECKDFEFLGNVFITHPVTSEIEKIIIPDHDFLKVNLTLLNCCFQYEDNHTSFVTAKNKIPIEIFCEDCSVDDMKQRIIHIVQEKVDAVEEHLIFTTNLHIFFPVVKITAWSEDETKRFGCGYANNRPMPYRKWAWIEENINLSRRLHLHIDKKMFDEFRLQPGHERYNRAFTYYIRAFYEFDHSSAFCLLCSALDAITGKSGSKDAKRRLAKYSSVLFCTPLKMKELNKKMEHFYRLRSDYVHGKGSNITVQDERDLREYVRKFLNSYYLFWGELNVKTEQQMLQKLDEIYANPSLYVQYAPVAYSGISLMDEHEKQPEGILQKSMVQKYTLAFSKIIEALIAKSPLSEENTKQNQDDL